MGPSCVSVTFSSMVVILLSHLPRTDNPLDIPTLLLFSSTESCTSRWETVSHSGSWTPCFIPNYWHVGVQMFACKRKILFFSKASHRTASGRNVVRARLPPTAVALRWRFLQRKNTSMPKVSCAAFLQPHHPQQSCPLPPRDGPWGLVQAGLHDIARVSADPLEYYVLGRAQPSANRPDAYKRVREWTEESLTNPTLSLLFYLFFRHPSLSSNNVVLRKPLRSPPRRRRRRCHRIPCRCPKRWSGQRIPRRGPERWSEHRIPCRPDRRSGHRFLLRG
jgi:hypothetical protein